MPRTWECGELMACSVRGGGAAGGASVALWTRKGRRRGRASLATGRQQHRSRVSVEHQCALLGGAVLRSVRWSVDLSFSIGQARGRALRRRPGRHVGCVHAIVAHGRGWPAESVTSQGALIFRMRSQVDAEREIPDKPGPHIAMIRRAVLKYGPKDAGVSA